MRKDEKPRKRDDADTYAVDAGIKNDRWEAHEAAIRNARNFLLEQGLDLNGVVLITQWTEESGNDNVSMLADVQGGGYEKVADMILNALTKHIEANGGTVSLTQVEP